MNFLLTLLVACLFTIHEFIVLIANVKSAVHELHFAVRKSLGLSFD